MHKDAKIFGEVDLHFMRHALTLAKRAYGETSPNPLVGAILVKRGRMIGQGWHHRAGEPHAEIEAIRNAQARGHDVHGATLYVTLEPCCTYGRTPPCVEAIQSAGIKRVVVAATDPNPKHAGKAYSLLEGAGLSVTHGILAEKAVRLNESFNHWIVQGTPFVTVKAAMTLDGKIATVTGESKWITSEAARACAMQMRLGADAILVGANTVLADDPSLTFRGPRGDATGPTSRTKVLRRIVLDPAGRTPLEAKVVSDESAAQTTLVVANTIPRSRREKLSAQANVLIAPTCHKKIDLPWLLKRLGSENVTSLLVEGGGEANASFLLGSLAQRIVFFYAPKIIRGSAARKAVSGRGIEIPAEILNLQAVEWRRVGPDLMLTARLG